MQMKHEYSDDCILDINRPVIDCHPVETGRYIIPTIEISRMFQKVSTWIKYRNPGGIIYGRPRIGKTWATKFLIKTLPKVLGGDLPVYHITSLHEKIASPGIFFEHLLKDVGHEVVYSGKTNVKRERLYKFLLHKGDSSKHKRIVMFIDDAQCLLELQYGWLMDIYNQLNQEGITLTTILVGQKELIHQRSAFKLAQKHQIIGRFMTQDHQFSGLKTLEDIQICLRGYDQGVEYPENSGWSYTRYFFPEEFACGERLENCTKDIFDLFNEIRNKERIFTEFEIPMQYLITAIEYAFLEYGANGRIEGWLNKTIWKEAIEMSGYIQAESYNPQD